ncbi:MAG: 30S ribosomal protein S5 [Nanoarchaeota archaeon]|nr:30S ribosomal protein S5 [Nanoarchaeota archaeon]
MVFNKDNWTPRTELGEKVKKGEITNIDEILDKGLKILEPEIVDMLIGELEVDLLEIGQSKGKFGGGKRSIWRQTQKKTKEGNKPSFATIAVCGNGNGYVGIGFGKAKETVPAREKATSRAKLNIIKVKRGCGSWVCGCGTPHSIPYTVEGKCSSVEIKLMPAPKGTRLNSEKECQKILKMAGFKDVYSKARGKTATKINLIYACFDALKKIGTMKVKEDYVEKAGIVGGRNE